MVFTSPNVWGVLGFYVNFSLHMAYVILNVNALLERVKHLTLSSQPKSHSTWLLVIGLNSCPSSKFEIFFKKDHHLKKKKKFLALYKIFTTFINMKYIVQSKYN